MQSYGADLAGLRRVKKGPVTVFEAKRYAEDIRDRAVAAVLARRMLNPKDRTIFREVAADYNVGEQSLRLWVKKVASAPKPSSRSIPGDTDVQAVAVSEDISEISDLRRQVERLKAENALLKRAFVMFSSDWAE